MIIVPVKEGENIEKALKKFKRKFKPVSKLPAVRAEFISADCADIRGSSRGV